MDSTRQVDAILAWYDRHARDLPWRRPDADPWGVLVSEFMLQQTPVARVLAPWRDWLQRWPTPAALAADDVGEAVRAWGRLGYPRRAQRLHAAASVIVERHAGRVPSDPEQLRALPGVGDYTAAAVAAFAYGARTVVLDVNVRRVLARLATGSDAPQGAPSSAERRLAQAWLPEGPDAPRWSVAAMELGAQLCRASAPRCAECPVAGDCRWLAAGRPAGPPRRRQLYAGTDRAARGRVLAVLREQRRDRSASVAELIDGWPDPAQARAALASLVADGLVLQTPTGYRL
ncbi:A/G-specific adenine glycosylase [Micropruina sonneratiae]|uniref:A/G-specific adenine glycosylase n=1 Tax=Micropruina sonneratiae TaxID=2986940 RepID=UPI002226C539|nr:A/G-specific adenine glycosylase [Micropruina sp. KQZ13P-5]MCW3156624.1 A/G-specific adenine glycosylase [Micropruina sp. KQZ13P-5]